MNATRSKRPKTVRPLFEGADWTFDLIRKVYDAIEEIGVGELGLNLYPNQIEVITAEQMLDAYASIGMPHMYRHWSFGKHFAREESSYRRGARSLAYELVINSNPCISYVMEENSMTMQTLVLAHAAMGHNHFFKNNYTFRDSTHADSILDYLEFARAYVAKCEEKHGLEAVEAVLDAAHALMPQAVSRNPGRRQARALKNETEREMRRRDYEEATFNDLWRTVPRPASERISQKSSPEAQAEARSIGLPEENLLYFLEKHAPKLEDWQRELLRIVRMMAQYFYPQRLTKLMNEGCATYTHYTIMNRLYDKGLITEGSMLEFLHSHSSVIAQPSWNDRRFFGLNPYAFGFAIMRDIQRICEEPTSEDRDWFPDIAGNGDVIGTLKQIWADYRDDSFVLQFLSPKVIRDFRLFGIYDQTKEPSVRVQSIHDERGYREIRRLLARHYDASSHDPDLQIVEADLSGARRLSVTHYVRNGVLLDKENCDRTLRYLARLWGYRVRLVEVDSASGQVLKEHEAFPIP